MSSHGNPHSKSAILFFNLIEFSSQFIDCLCMSLKDSLDRESNPYRETSPQDTHNSVKSFIVSLSRPTSEHPKEEMVEGDEESVTF